MGKMEGMDREDGWDGWDGLDRFVWNSVMLVVFLFRFSPESAKKKMGDVIGEVWL